MPLRNTKKELEERKKEKLKKEQKEARKQKGHYIPRYELDRAKETELKSIAMKGGIMALMI